LNIIFSIGAFDNMPVVQLLSFGIWHFVWNRILYFYLFVSQLRFSLTERFIMAPGVLLAWIVNIATTMDQLLAISPVSVLQVCKLLGSLGCWCYAADFGRLGPYFLFLVCLVYNAVWCMLPVLDWLESLRLRKLHLFFFISSCWCHYWVLGAVLSVSCYLMILCYLFSYWLV